MMFDIWWTEDRIEKVLKLRMNMNFPMEKVNQEPTQAPTPAA